MRYRPEIDGLRAIAVIPVILYHTNPIAIPGGFAGVDVFFVISGYLIARLLLDEFQSGTYSVTGFYRRRALRIVPALAVVALSVTALSFFIEWPDDIARESLSLAAVSAFVSNLHFLGSVGYFASLAGAQPLLHTWSLAIEEQYYLLFPLLLAFLLKGRARSLLPVLVVLALVSFGIALFGAGLDQEKNFYFSLSRFWELLVGALAAGIRWRPMPTFRNVLGLAGLLMVLASYWLVDAARPTPGWQTLLPVLGAALVVFAPLEEGLLLRALSARPLVGVGLISYSAYLWHQPLLVLTRKALVWPSEGTLYLAAAASLPLAWVTWRFVEQPARAWGRLASVSNRRILLTTGAALAVMFCLGLAGYLTRGFEQLWLGASDTRAQQWALYDAARDQDLDDTECVFQLTKLDQPAISRIRSCASRMGPATIILGDSHGIALYRAVARQRPQAFVVGLTEGGCRIRKTEKECFYGDLLAFAAAHPELIAVVAYQQAGFYLLSPPSGVSTSRSMLAEVSPQVPFPEFPPNTGEIAYAKGYLEALAMHVPVVWVGPYVEPHIPAKVVAAHICSGDIPVRPNPAALFEQLDIAIAGMLKGSTVRYLSLIPLLRFSFPADFGDCSGLYWTDGDHFSALGQKVFGARINLLPALQAALSTQ